jgi:hypothetical protein
MRACGKQYKNVEEAQRSKAVLQFGAIIDPDCWCCGGVHVRVPKASSVPVLTGRPSVWSLTGPGEFTVRVKRLIRLRAGNGDPSQAECESCGIFLGTDGGEFQHRTSRGAGGCRDSVINGPAGGVLLCGAAALGTGCHGRAERRVREMRDDAQGFWIRHGTTPGFDPRLVPVLWHANGGSGLPVWLGEDGEYLYTRPRELAA